MCGPVACGEARAAASEACLAHPMYSLRAPYPLLPAWAKSVPIVHLLGGLAKFEGICAFVFNDKEGARFMIDALGGAVPGHDGWSPIR